MQEKYYLTVDECSLKRWRKANEGDLTWLRIDKNIGSEKEDLEAWELLYKNFISVIGLSKDFKEYLELLSEKIELQFEYLESQTNKGIRNRFILNRIKILNAQIEQYHQSAGKGLTIKEMLIRLSKSQGYHLNENEIKVDEYFTLINDFNNG